MIKNIKIKIKFKFKSKSNKTPKNPNNLLNHNHHKLTKIQNYRKIFKK